MARLFAGNLRFWCRVFLGLSLCMVFTIGFCHFNLHDLTLDILLWIRGLGNTGVFAFMLVYNLATVFLIPGALLTLGGGALYGMFWGSIYVVIAAMLGATIAFLIGRYYARTWVQQKLQRYVQLQEIDRAVAQQGLKIVFLTRLSPVFPFNLLNYAFGISQVSWQNYILGSVGMFPGILLYVYMGSLVADLTRLGQEANLSRSAQFARWGIHLFGLLATIAVTFYLTRIAQKVLKHTVQPLNNS